MAHVLRHLQVVGAGLLDAKLDQVREEVVHSLSLHVPDTHSYYIQPYFKESTFIEDDELEHARRTCSCSIRGLHPLMIPMLLASLTTIST